jgi:hypothetical protein
MSEKVRHRRGRERSDEATVAEVVVADAFSLAPATPATCPGCRTACAHDSCLECGSALIAGRFRILAVIAQTERGRTYLAADEDGNRVALKELVFATVPDGQRLEAFHREVKTLQDLDHPNVPKVVDVFQTGRAVGTRLYLAQEFVAGDSLAKELTSARYTESRARHVAREVLSTLAYLHSRSLIHRDVKPANLIERADGTIALVDFDAVRELRSSRTYRSTLVGTFGYAPIEQLGGTVDPTSDLYALGATLLHLLTGREPRELYRPDFSFDLAQVENVGPALRAYLLRLVARNPAERFSSATEALDHLDILERSGVLPALGSTTRPMVIPSGPPAVERTRRRWMLGALAAAALVSLGSAFALRGPSLSAGAATAARTWTVPGFHLSPVHGHCGNNPLFPYTVVGTALRTQRTGTAAVFAELDLAVTGESIAVDGQQCSFEVAKVAKIITRDGLVLDGHPTWESVFPMSRPFPLPRAATLRFRLFPEDFPARVVYSVEYADDTPEFVLPAPPGVE